MTDVQIENMVVSFSIGQSLDLPSLAGMLPDVKYAPDEAPTLVLHVVNPRAIATVFSTGNVVMTGPRSIEDASVVMRLVIDRLRTAGVRPQGSPELRVQNVTATTDLSRSLDLRFLAKSLQHVEYKKKDFPGMIYTGDDPNTVILLFDSGKIICNGAAIETVTAALEKMLEKLLSFGIRKEEETCQK
jgi:transcription initiation factor TFIID TATA-box-binding protein